MSKPLKKISAERSREVFDYLLNMAQTTQDVESMTDDQLVDEVMKGIWSNLELSSKESAQLGELISRMKKLM